MRLLDEHVASRERVVFAAPFVTNAVGIFGFYNMCLPVGESGSDNYPSAVHSNSESPNRTGVLWNVLWLFYFLGLFTCTSAPAQNLASSASASAPPI